MGAEIEVSGSGQSPASRSNRGRHLAMGRRARRLVAVAWIGALVASLMVTGPAGAVAGDTTRISVSSDGVPGNLDSVVPSISLDGRYIAFESHASNLVEGDTNGAADVFVHDRLAGTTSRVSVASDGTQGNDHSISIAANNFGREGPTLSADGRYVAFSSLASNLVPGDTNDAMDVFVHDRETGTTTRVSVASEGTQASGSSFHPVISADGRYVAFDAEAIADTLVPDDTNEASDVFLHDRETATTTRISVASDGTQANWFSELPAISGDGRYVAFNSAASNLVDDDTNGQMDVFVRDTEEDTTRLVSLASDGTQATGGDSFAPVITVDGGRVAFSSRAADLVDGDTNGAPDVFVHDTQTSTTRRVSVASDGTQANAENYAPVIAGFGSVVAFESAATNLVPGDTNGVMDVFVHDLEGRATERASVASDGSEGNDFARSPAVDGLGQFVAFEARASNLIAEDINNQVDAFVHQLPVDLEDLLLGKLWLDASGDQADAPTEGAVTLELDDGRIVHEGGILPVEAGTHYTVTEVLPDGWAEVECPPEFQPGQVIGVPLDDPTKGAFEVLANGTGEFSAEKTGIHVVCNSMTTSTPAPSVALNPESGPSGTIFNSSGSGFTGNATVTSHLQAPDGTEFVTLTLSTDASGGFVHEIDSSGFTAGIYTHWAVDDKTGVESNRVAFEIALPGIVIDPDRGPRGTIFMSSGTGFSPNSTVTSHLRKPNGTEFTPLPLTTNADGAFVHEIDSKGFAPGTYTQWVVDPTGAVSNSERFEVTPPSGQEGTGPPSGPTHHRFLTFPLPGDSLDYLVDDGWRRCGGARHGGIDWGTVFRGCQQADLPVGTEVYAAADGWAVGSAQPESGGYGRFVMIVHDNGYSTLYAHLSRYSDQIGQNAVYTSRHAINLRNCVGEPSCDRPAVRVEEGERIGFSGESPDTYPHLHFEVAQNERANYDCHANPGYTDWNATLDDPPPFGPCGRLDPFGLYSNDSAYPDRDNPVAGCGAQHLWKSCPP